MYYRYRKEVEFVCVYVREAHPIEGWRMSSNDDAGIAIKQPTNYQDRKHVAGQCSTRLKITMPLVVDDLKDTVGNAYSGMPDRLYLIDKQGKVAYKGGRGPFGFKPRELEQSIILLLHEQARKKKR